MAVCDCGGVTAAAQQLYLAQPAVSQAIAELERHYDVRLFDRISRRLYLTDTGREFLSYARHITSLFDEMETALQNRDATGQLSIGSSITFGTRILPGLLQAYGRQYPQVRVQVKVENSEGIERLVLQNQLDFAFVEALPSSPHLMVESLLDDQLGLLCAPNHPLAKLDSLSPSMLEKIPFLLRERGSGTRDLFDGVLLTHGVTVNPVWESSSVEALISACKAGFGVTVLSLRMVEDQLKSGALQVIPVEQVSFQRHFYLVWHQRKFLSPAAQDFISLSASRLI